MCGNDNPEFALDCVHQLGGLELLLNVSISAIDEGIDAKPSAGIKRVGCLILCV